MQKIIKINSGIYILEIFSPQNFFIQTKKIKHTELQKGFYYYVGSAQKNLIQRLKRHLRKEKIIHWHIDTITSLNFCSIRKIYLFINYKKDFECKIVNDLRKELSLSFPLLNFGNSDCSNCKSHLLFSKSQIPYSHFISRYQSIVLFNPTSSDIF